MRKVNLIPMAGEGIRFIDAGYTTPKPLIDINGLPMVIRAAKCLPDADQWIFICREHHIKKTNIDKILIHHFPKALILSVDHLTDGQASTCLLARKYLMEDDQLTIGTCDNGMDYDSEKFNRLFNNNDAIVWTFRGNSSVLYNPKMYGWVNVNQSKKATGISCKVPISDTPIKDHAIVGTFSFKKASYFLEYADKLIKKNKRVKNEFYLDSVMDECIIEGNNVITFEINNYVCWGTPQDLEVYLK